MGIVDISISDDIPGVFSARQKRSVRIRDSFIVVGVDALNQKRLDDLTISELSRSSGNSVGGFYTRFKDKNAYFRALRVFTLHSLEKDHIADFATLAQSGLPELDLLDALVDLMVDIFTSRYRGVLRETLLKILDSEDPWAPMRESAVNIVNIVQANLDESFTGQSIEIEQTRLRFCFQMIVGVLQNDLVNDYHVHTTRDDSIRLALKDVVRAYMQLESPAKSTMTVKVS
ncbi:hypothetical protein N9850_08790 [Granulosicoccus sp.]|jgi:AcrR family transcriptional regulator|nr:hypothetical protein [Granulosicoccus sp.]MDB4223857.1 hypothetical protein [Granulosicoccus sp.]